jgi:hypothetical protein
MGQVADGSLPYFEISYRRLLTSEEKICRMSPLHPGKKLLVLFLSLACLHSPRSWAQTANPSATQPPAANPSQATQPSAGNGYGNSTTDGGKGESSDTKDGKPSADARPIEDWNALAIPRDLKVADPRPPLQGDFPAFTREFMQVAWRQGDVIDLYVIKPAGVEKPPVILYLYSFPSDTDRFQDNEFAQLVTKGGFAAVGFVSALTGQRYHSVPQKKWFISELQEALGSSVHDVQLILNYLEKRGDLDMSRVGMYGGGSGGSIAIMAAAVDPRIKVLDLLDPWGDWQEWLAKSTLVPDDERAAYLKPEFLKNVENLDPVKWLPTLTTQRVRLQYLKDDTTTPILAREGIEAAAPPNIQIVQYENAKAYIAKVGDSGEKMFDWAKEQLQSAGHEENAAVGTHAQASSQSSGSRR